MRLEGKRIVITGAGSGIGFAILKQLAQYGNEIVAADRDVSAVLSAGFDGVHPVVCDISSEEGVSKLFSESIDALGGIDAIFCNAGFPYYEIVDHPDWVHIERIFLTNTISHIHIYEKFVEHLDGRAGSLCYTVSAMGQVSMPGFAIYSSTKYAMNGFVDAISFEKPDNLTITSSYPVSTDTNFFKRASRVEMVKPFPLQTPEHVAKRMIRGVERGSRSVYPSRLFHLCRFLFVVFPPLKWAYRRHYQKHLRNHVF